MGAGGGEVLSAVEIEAAAIEVQSFIRPRLNGQVSRQTLVVLLKSVEQERQDSVNAVLLP